MKQKDSRNIDKWLSDSFRNESIPPRSGIWEKISEGIAPRQKRRFWLWLPMSILAVSTIVTGIGLSLDRMHVSQSNGQSQETNEPATPVPNPARYAKSAEHAELPQNPSSDRSNLSHLDKNNRTAVNAKNNNSVNSGSASNEYQTSPVRSVEPKRHSESHATHMAIVEHVPDRNPEVEQTESPSGTPVTADVITLNANELPVDMNPAESLPTSASEGVVSNEEETISLQPNNLKLLELNNRKNDSVVNIEQNEDLPRTPKLPRWGFELMVGPAINFNNAKMNSSLYPFIHEGMRNNIGYSLNGSGWNASALIKKRLNRRFSIQTGLEYHAREENIAVNFNSEHIPVRNSNGVITSYRTDSSKVLVYNQVNGQYDTVWVNKVQNYYFTNTNKYKVFVIPININYVVNLGRFIQLSSSFGIGVSYSKASNLKYYNPITTVSCGCTTEKKEFNTTFNGRLILYRRLGDLGSFGFGVTFTNYNRNLVNQDKVYEVKTGDLSYGFSYKYGF